jgi:hypothetical protein
MGYPIGMIDLKLEEPVTEEIEVDAETLDAIDRGLEAADRGETVSLEEARKMIPQWISKFESPGASRSRGNTRLLLVKLSRHRRKVW